MELSEVLAAVEGAGPAHIATVRADGGPHVATSSLAVLDGDLWFFTFGTSAKARNLRADPRIAVEWESPSGEVYLWGTAEEHGDLAAKERVWTSGALPYDPVGFFGSPDSPELVLFRVVPERAMVQGMTPEGPAQRRWPT